MTERENIRMSQAPHESWETEISMVNIFLLKDTMRQMMHPEVIWNEVGNAKVFMLHQN